MFNVKNQQIIMNTLYILDTYGGMKRETEFYEQ